MRHPAALCFQRAGQSLSDEIAVDFLNDIRKGAINTFTHREDEERYMAKEQNVIHAYWIHDRKPDPSFLRGYALLPSCTCSHCGARFNFERDRCSCGAYMDAPPKEEESQ